jgi:hypothetical protein
MNKARIIQRLFFMGEKSAGSSGQRANQGRAPSAKSRSNSFHIREFLYEFPLP